MTQAADQEAVSPRRAEPGGPGRLRSTLDFIGPQNLALVGALIIVIITFTFLDSGYLTWPNAKVVGEAVTVVGLLASVETVVIICGALDISVGSQAGLAAVISAMAFTSAGHQPFAGIAAAVGVGILAGLVNALVIVYGRVNPIIATLATLAAYKGVAQLVSGGRSQGYVGSDDVFIFISNGKIAGIPTLIVILIIVAAAIHVMLKYTDVGRNIYAIGGNDTAARLAGININKYLIAVYILSGIVCALAGVILTARTGSGHPTAGSEGLELQAITAAALGGANLRGGKGGIPGTLLAVVLLGSLNNGLNVVGVNTFWQNVAQGALLVVAVIIQQRRAGERAVGVPT